MKHLNIRNIILIKRVKEIEIRPKDLQTIDIAITGFASSELSYELNHLLYIEPFISYIMFTLVN